MESCVDGIVEPIRINWDGSIFVSVVARDGSASIKARMFPVEAARLWKALSGPKGLVSSVEGLSPLLMAPMQIIVDNRADGSVVIACGEHELLLRFAQAALLEWGVKAAMEYAMVVKEPQSQHRDTVWVLSCRQVLIGDSAASGSDLVGGHERVFASREMAMDAVREFMRPLVNEAETSVHWEDGTTVDDELDDILERADQMYGHDRSNSGRIWTYTGLVRAFEVELAEREVE